jgi:hypothetical protein
MLGFPVGTVGVHSGKSGHKKKIDQIEKSGNFGTT